MEPQPASPKKPSRSYRRRTVQEKGPQIRRHRAAAAGDYQSTSMSKDSKRQRDSNSTICTVPSMIIPPVYEKPWSVRTAILTLVDYLLYARGLFPMTVAEVTAHCKEMNHSLASNSLSSSARRKIKQACSQRENLTRFLTTDTSRDLIRRASYALLSIGPSYGRGRESYLIDIQGLSTLPSQETTFNIDSAKSASFSRNLLRRMIESKMDLPSTGSPSFRLFISLWVRNDEVEDYWKFRGVECLPAGNSIDDQWTPRTGRVLPKDTELLFSRSRKSKRIHYQLRFTHQKICSEAGSEAANAIGEHQRQRTVRDHDFINDDSMVDDGQWLCVPFSVSGFRL